jgi:hypothetical protein
MTGGVAPAEVIILRLDQWAKEIEERLAKVEEALSPPETQAEAKSCRGCGSPECDCKRCSQWGDGDDACRCPRPGEDEPSPEYHYVALLDCGHYMELMPSWNSVLQSKSYDPETAFCRKCADAGAKIGEGMNAVVKFAKVEL